MSIDIRNGQVWDKPWPFCDTVIIQWIGGDRWGILSAPYPAASGGTAIVSEKWTRSKQAFITMGYGNQPIASIHQLLIRLDSATMAALRKAGKPSTLAREAVEERYKPQ